MSHRSTRSTARHIRFNESVQIIVFRSYDDMKTTSYCAWYNSRDIARFREDRRREIHALKFNDGGEANHLSCRGIEQMIFQPSNLRKASRKLFVRKVLHQQAYETLKTNTESHLEDRLAAKVCRWSMASVDQAIMRAKLEIENHQQVNCYNHSALVDDDDHLLMLSLQCSTASIKMAIDQESFRQLPCMVAAERTRLRN